ncbi:MAG: asparagine synthase (glutamine-hydrolyzing) [Acidobacteria bacterium]|nr:asparagine synthase (glutamine-hydrolyzing) [Acidobacteriota bacterium]
MCGICGILNLELEPAAHRERIDRMSARLEHRGPDSHGKFELPHVALAIRRLSIIDLETGDQPLSNETGSVTLVFNGEIYNYRELREGLLERGHRFKTRSDGEVIAHLYEERGPDFVRELNGMFAIALWDESAKRLVLARDRAGEKPLFYWLRDRTLVFGSEIKALFEYPGISRELDLEAVNQYFFYGYFPAPRSVYAEVKKLPAAHRMVVERGEARIEPYWRLQEHLCPPGRPRLIDWEKRALVEALRRRLREAAISRLVSDVPLGVFLSGGIDSSTLVATMSELTPGNVNTFSVAFPEKTFNEASHARFVARHFSTRHHEVTADGTSLRDALDFLAGHLDEPLADPAMIPTYLLSRFARQHIKVALSGEGSDELFGGYPTYPGVRLAEYYLKLPRFVRRRLIEPLARLLPVSPSAVPLGLFLRRFLAHAERDPAERHQIWMGMFSPRELDRLFSPQWKGPSPPSSVIFAPLAPVMEGARFDETLAEMLYLDFRLYLEDNLLVKIDRASMASSLELRTPFLDHRLVEFAASLPAALKVPRFQMKYVLKKAVEAWLPRQIVYRQKRGFSVPIAGWMRGSLRPLLDETLGEEKLKRDGLFDAAFVRRILTEHWSGRADHRKGLWALLCFQLWFDRWARS